MFLQIIRIIGIVVFMLLGFQLTHFLLKKGFKLNRWICAVAICVLVPIPLLIFPNMPTFLTYTIYAICALLIMAFFELSRIQLEQREEAIKKMREGKNK